MKKAIILSSACIAIALGACTSSSTKTEQATISKDSTAIHTIDTTQLAVGTVFYQCPMHLEEVSDKPGACPKCGMDLEKMTKQ